MSSRLEVTHSQWGAPGVQHLMQRQVARALAGLSTGRPARHEVHEVRKSLKAARAALRLLRPALSEEAYALENHALRDAGRALGAARDDAVLVSVMQELRPHLKGSCARRARKLSAELRQRSQLAWDRAVRLGVPKAQRKLREASTRIATWSFEPRDWKSVRRGLMRTYRKGRRDAKRNERHASSPCLHEWRKSSEYLRNQLLLLEPLQHASLARVSDKLSRLNSQLGDDHDLAVLNDVARSARGRLGRRTTAALRKLIRKRRKKLQRQALAGGAAAYAERPGPFESRLRRYFRRWPD
jgi:CHAD domain-containing protein